MGHTRHEITGRVEDPCRLLAIAVIGRALDDLLLSSPRGDRPFWAAFNWLGEEDDVFAFWCEAARLKPSQVLTEAQYRLAQRQARSAPVVASTDAKAGCLPVPNDRFPIYIHVGKWSLEPTASVPGGG